MTFPIVAIGASAGGLEAVSDFLGAVPTTGEMAYVVVQHLDPAHKSFLAEIWAKKTTLPVISIQNDGLIEPRRVYVIPPNTTLTIEADRFKLVPRPPGKHHPVDILFNSLAEQRGEAAIGIVLSGGDSDGSLGVRAIKHGGGITFAQEPTSARFAEMPNNAIATGCVDFILLPPEIARELSRLSVHPYLRSLSEQQAREASVPGDEEHWKRVFRRLRTAHGVDFTHYKRSTLRRRLARRMALRQLEDFADYVAVAEDDAAEAAALYQDFLIRVTGFFRDPEVFEALRNWVFPKLCESRSPKEPIRIWVTGCASGEEVYSIAIALVEFLGDRLSPSGVQIFGTDVSETEIEKARAGYYLANITAEVSAERLQRFFVKDNGHYRIAKTIRDLCIFARQDVTRDPPFSRLDFVSCRNLLIYLDARAQSHVMQLFHYSLRATGYLMLGPSETVGQASDLFELIDRDRRLYARKAGAGSAAERAFSELPPTVRPRDPQDGAALAVVEPDSAQQETDRLLLARYAPATLLVDADLNILQFRGETARFLEHASGAPSMNLQRVVRSELMVEIAPALAEARAGGLSVRREGLALDELQDVSIEVIPLKAGESRGSFAIIFEDASRRPASRRAASAQPLPESEKDRRLGQLEREVTSTRDYLQATIEEQEAVKEELKSAHEEVLSANEEFQSTNEELETAKEELQSANEELSTTNEELRDRNRELSVLNAEIEKARGLAERARTYADGIVATVRDPLLVLDSHLKVLRANPAFYESFQAAREATEGCPFPSLIGGQWNIPDLLQQIKATLSASTDVNDYELGYASPQGLRRLLFNARRIVGDAEREQLILLAIEDVTENRAATATILESEERFRTAVAAMGGVVWTTNALGEMQEDQSAWQDLTGQRFEDYQGLGWAQALHPEDAQPTLAAWREAVLTRTPFSFEHRVRRRNGEWGRFAERAIPRFDAHGAVHQWVGVHTDVTELRRLEAERTQLLEAEQTARTQSESANRVKDEFLATLSHELRTPITIIVGWSRLLIKKHGDTNEDLRKGLNLIINNAMSQAQIISDLLDMSSIVSGKTILHPKPIDLKECVAQCVTAQQLQAKERGIELLEEQAEGPAVVLADPGRLSQVFGNLLTNALKFTPAGGRVVVRQQPVGDAFEVAIEDTGEGIAPDFLGQIFARFRQEDNSGARRHGGLGLGLAIVKQLTELSGGSVRAESQGRGQGARFTVSLPAQAQATAEDLENSINAPAETYSTEGLQRINALVVEDNVAMLEFLLRILEERGALVIGVRTASAALEALAASQGISFNVLISDIGLPGIDGYELIRRIRKDLNLPPARLAAVAVTAFGRKEDRQRAFESGFQAHLSKPYEIGQLVATLQKLV